MFTLMNINICTVQKNKPRWNISSDALPADIARDGLRGRMGERFSRHDVRVAATGGRTTVKALFYDWFGLNEWLFAALYSLHFPFLGTIWRVISYAYSYWAAAFVVLATCYRYMRIRHRATEMQLERMGAFLVELITAFSVVWCVVYTFQNISLLPRPWLIRPDLVAMQVPLLWHEGLPASASAIAVMLAVLAWRYLDIPKQRYLVAYVVLGTLLSVISGVNWPVEVVAGAALGWVGARVGQWYLRFARRVVAP